MTTALCAAAILFPVSAHADDTAIEDTAAPTSPSPETHVYSFSTELQLGAYGASENGGGMPLAGLAVLGHYGPIEGGGLVEGGTQFLGGSMTGYAGLAGLGYDITPHLHFSLLGELGRHEYSNMGAVLFGPPGVSGNLSYAGGRVGLVYGFGHEIRFTLGGWFFLRDDLERKTESGTYDAGLFAPDRQPYTAGLGQTQTGFALRLGAEFGGI